MKMNPSQQISSYNRSASLGSLDERRSALPQVPNWDNLIHVIVERLMAGGDRHPMKSKVLGALAREIANRAELLHDLELDTDYVTTFVDDFCFCAQLDAQDFRELAAEFSGAAELATSPEVRTELTAAARQFVRIAA